MDKSADTEYRLAIMNEGYKKLKTTASTSEDDAPKIANRVAFTDIVLDESWIRSKL